MSVLATRIRNEIEANGPITFARFMDRALYSPELGSYERRANSVGPGGDFYTSVSVGSLFGELLAFQFAQWWDERGPETGAGGVQIVEGGAHGGQLALDILTWLETNRTDLFGQLEYW